MSWLFDGLFGAVPSRVADPAMAQLEMEDPKKVELFRRIATDSYVDPVDLTKEIDRKVDPIQVKGLHRRAILAMREFRIRDNADVIVRRTWFREREELCGDKACMNAGGIAIENVLFLASSSPNGFGPSKKMSRHVVVMGVLSMAAPICAKDEVIISSTSGSGTGRTTFRLCGESVRDGRPCGVMVNGHPYLYRDFVDFKRGIVGDLAYK